MIDSLDLLRGVNLYLVGMMGAGKSAVGQAVAKRLGYRFLDTDALIESVAQRPISDIFATDGEAAFRELEAAVLEQAVAYTRSVVATGGGMVLRRENWGHLRHGVVVWLDVPLPILTQRLQRDRSRPLLQRPDWQDHLANLMAQRRPLYQEADIHLTVQPKDSIAVVGDRLLEMLNARIEPAPTVAAPGDD